MPLPPSATNTTAANGAILAVVNGDGTIPLYKIPRSASINIQPAVGFGPVWSANFPGRAAAEGDIDEILGQQGANG